jgi:hypothetical protein
MRPAWLTLVSWLCLAPVVALAAGPRKPTPEEKALAYLAREVPAWAAENKCYSCHNNGDAARALYTATRLGYSVPARALADTTRWLSQPDRWKHNGGEGKFNDKKLAAIQFAAALADAIEAGRVKERKALRRAAKLVAGHQEKDGSWKIGAEANLGSPATYGARLATVMARRTLLRADARRYRRAVARADAWLRKVPVKNVMDAAAVLLGLAGAKDRPALARRKKCLGLIRKGQSKDGGWGPYVNSASEPFDTALVILALDQYGKMAGVRGMLKRGRTYLIATQDSDGAWPATTRPAGAESYAQHVSTTGWATLALLVTRNDGK